jgi:hypothetical protein
MGALALLQSNALNALARVAPTASSTVITNIFFRKPGSWPEEPRMRHSPCPARLVRLGTSSALSALPCFSSAGAALVARPISIHAGLSTDCIILKLSSFMMLLLTCLGIHLWLSNPSSKSTSSAGLAKRADHPLASGKRSSTSWGGADAPKLVIRATPVALSVWISSLPSTNGTT